MTDDFHDLTEAYMKERPRYERLAAKIDSILDHRLKDACITHETAHRPKGVVNFVRKAIRKGYADPMSEIRDKAGVRVLVPFIDLLAPTAQVVGDALSVQHDENKRQGIEPDKLGYLGWHFEVSLLDRDAQGVDADLAGLVCEVQLHTRAQNAWSEVSHDLTYKPISGDVDHDLERRLFRLMALVELFDEEASRVRESIRNSTGYIEAVMLSSLEDIFVPLTKRDFDRQLSLDMLAIIKTSYSDEELTQFSRLMAEFVEGKREVIKGVYSMYATNEFAHPLLFQPEALAIFERATKAPAKLRHEWERQGMSTRLLRSLAEIFGVAV